MTMCPQQSPRVVVKQPVQLPLGLQSGDRIVIRNCGAYTSTYASVGFNGFPPLDVIAI